MKWLVLFCFPVVVSAYSVVVRTRSWEEAGRLLNERSVRAVVVENAVSLDIQKAWAQARSGEVRGPAGTLRETLSAVCEDEEVLENAEALARDFGTHAVGGDQTRFKAAVATNERAMQPCPKIHTDDVSVRCLIAAVGPGTVVVDRAFLLPFDDRLPDSAFFQANTGDALLLKGRKWGLAARHRSPKNHQSNKRVLLSMDRLDDV